MAPVTEVEEPLGPSDMAFVRKLKDVVPRLELLGFTLANARAAYDRWTTTWCEDREAIRDDLDLPDVTPLTFDEFLAFAASHRCCLTSYPAAQQAQLNAQGPERTTEKGAELAAPPSFLRD